METNQTQVEKNLKLIAKSSVFVFMSLILSKIFTYIYKVIIARSYNPEVYGVFSLASMIASLFVVFFSFGLNEGLLRFIAIYRGKNQKARIKYSYDFSAKILIFSGMIGFLLLFFLAETISINFFHDKSLIPFLQIFSISIPIAIISQNFLSYIRSYELIGWYMFISTALKNFSHVVFILLFFLLGLISHAIELSFLMGFIIMFIASYLIFKRKISINFNDKSLNKKENKIVRKEVLNYSIPLIFSSFIFMFFGWIDSFSLGYFKTSAEVGLYNAALPIAMLLFIAPELFIKMFFPLINKEYGRKNLEVIKELSKQVSKWIFLINLPILILLLAFPETIINILFGAKYLEASTALIILSIGFFISSGIGAISLRNITMTGRSKLILFNVIIVSIINISLNAVLIPMEKISFINNSLGINGAAIATFVSLLVISLIQLLQAKYLVNILPARRSFFKIILASIIPIILLIYSKRIIEVKVISFFIISILFALLYIALIIILKGYDRNDIAIFKSVKNKALRGFE